MAIENAGAPQNALHGGGGRGIKGQLWVFEGPRPPGHRKKNDFVQKKHFWGKRLFDPKLAQNAHKVGQNGVHWGVYRVHFGFLRVPDPLGAEIMQKKCF